MSALATLDGEGRQTTQRFGLLGLDGLLTRAVRGLRPGLRGSGAAADADRASRSETPIMVAQELEAIQTYARFLLTHEDMPAAHRERFLSQIIRCSDQARSQVGRPD